MATTRLAPLWPVTGPAASPSLHGLVASVGGPTPEPNERWTLGFTWDPETCTIVSVYDPSCAGEPPTPGNDAALASPLTWQDLIEHQPAILNLAVERCTWGFADQDYPGRPLRQLEAGTSKAVEAELWSSTIAGNQSLAVSGCDISNPVSGSVLPWTPRRALAAIEQEAANCGVGGRAVIHAPVDVASIWAYDGAVVEDGQRLVTRAKGNIVVAGAGYTGLGPEGHAQEVPADPDHRWVYVTGMIQVRLSDIVVTPDRIEEALDRATNTITYRAMRFGAANFDPCCGPVAVLVDLGA
jgi:hypothetical protein